MASTDVKYIVSRMSTVLVVPVDGINLKDRGEQKKIEGKIEAKVKEIVNKLKSTHEKFEDPDFGPNEKDEFGALSFYGSSLPAPAGSKYPAPETLRWERPIYDDSKFSYGAVANEDEPEEEAEEVENDYDDEFGFSGGDDQDSVWCRHGKLFLDGTSSGDVIQGQLGDCWFLSALAVMGANESLLQTCFWKEDSFKEYGLYVLRFYKDCNVVFVIVDDRLPVKAKDGKLIFAGNKDPNELWVPLIEKAYAKLHGCYKALIGGYTHFGLADMTGFCPRLIVTREGFLGYSEKYEPDEIWDLLVQYRKWSCLMGCSIQSNPKEKQKIEADAGQGLHMGHAYSLLAVGEIDLSKGKGAKPGAKAQLQRLVKLRNPWGRGEWEGPFGDRSDEREAHDAEIERVFHASERAQERAEVNFNDGTFFMTFEQWMTYFTSLFVAVNFPSAWTGKRTQGQWSGDQGGNRQMGTWISNPKIKFRIEKDPNRPDEEFRQVFVGLYIKDSRLTMGADYCKDPLYATPLAFDIVTEAELQVDFKGSRDFIPHSQRSLALKAPVKQPPYNYGTTQVDAFLKVGVDYYIVPSLYKRNQPGTFFLNVFADATNFHLDGSIIVSDAQKPMVVGSKEDSKVALKMSVGQYYDRKEQLRERIVSEAKRLNLSAAQLEAKFSDCRERLRLSAFKRRMMDMGFMLTDFPDSDLVVLDADNDGTISHKEFLDFFREGLSFTEASTVAPPPEPPVDDLLYKAVDLAGELTVHVGGARALREATTWFNSSSKAAALAEASGGAAGESAGAGSTGAAASVTGAGKTDPTSRRLIKYDPAEAQKLHKAVTAERQAALDAVLNASPKNKPAAGSGGGPAGPGGKGLAETLTAPLTLDNINALNTTGTIPFASPKSVNPKAAQHRGKVGAGGTGHDAGTAITGMSLAKTELLQKAGKEAAQKLHSDPNLQKAEVARTKFLGLLRSHQKNKDGAAEKEAAGVLRKKTKHVAKLEKRDITKDIEAMYLLNYWPNGGPGGVGEGTAEIAVRQPMALPSAGAGAPSPLLKGYPSVSAKLSLTQGSFKLRPGKVPVNAADAAAQPRAGSPATVPALPLVSAVSATVVVAATSRYKSVTSDLWDYLIDCVVTISVSRPRSAAQEQQRAMLQSKSRRVTSQAMALFDPPRTPIPAPSTKAAPARPLRGTAVTPRTTRHTPGHASVTTAQSKSKQQATILDAKERLQGALKDGGTVYEEVYRRLIRMPVTSHSELEGDRGAASTSGNSVAAKSHTYLRALFERFDKNLNGYISKDEFKIAMSDINVEVSNEDCDIFFNRFKGERPGNIDWKEFIRFFDTHLSGAATTAATAPSAKSLVQLLSTVKAALSNTASKMVELRIATLETFLSLETTKTVAMTSATVAALAAPSGAAGATGAAGTGDKAKTFALPDNAIFQSLATTPAQLKTNVGIMQKLGVAVSEEEMARISRIFRNQTAALMTFARTPQSDLDLVEILEIADFEVTKGLNQRTGMATVGADHTSSIAKLWSSLAPNLSCTVGFEPLAAYLTTMLLEANVFDEAIKLSPRGKDAPPAAGAKPHTQASIRGVDAHILCRIIADTLVYSSWNRETGNSAVAASAAPLVATAPGAVAGVKTSIPAPTAELKSALSFSGLDAYVRNNRINYIERKLKYLMQLEANYSGAEVCMLVHVFFSTAQNEFVVLALDPLSGDIHKLSFKEDLKHLPMGEKLVKLFMNTPRQEELINKRLNTSAVHYYNPWDTPAEDAAVSELVNRLRLVRAKTSTSASFLVLAEEPKFIATLNSLFNSPTTSALPFFSIINDLTLTFEVHDERLLSHSSIRSFVFGHIRKQKPLCSFLEGVSSSLNVVLSTYNGGIRETFKWKELLSHLTNYRNPFFTIQLLPPFLEPEQYIYTPENNTSAFTGDEDGADDACPKLKSAVDYDGAPHPAWDSDFKFQFRPPQLTNCKVLSTEVAKVKVDDKYKYAVLMVRKGKRAVPGQKEKQPFKFLTVYDPRSATDFQCGVKPGCKLYDQLYAGKDGSFPRQLELTPFMQCVAEAAEQDKIIVGPAITPRLEINVYNECGRTQELLGSCQVSVSSVLSGSGISEKQRMCLTYKQELPAGKSIDAAAGDIQLEMRFRGQMQIDAEAQAEEERLRNAGKRAVVDDGPTVTRSKSSAAVRGKVSVAAGEKITDTTGKLEDLRTENDTLALEAKKLKEKLAATTAEVEALKTTGAAAALSAELKAAQEEQARLAAEKARVEAEKAALAEKLAKVAEQNQKEIAALKEANALALQKKQEQDQIVQTAQPQVDVTATDEYRRLFEAYEQMRLKLEAAQDRPIAHGSRNVDSTATLPQLHKSTSRPEVEGSQAHLTLRTGEESVTSIVHAILNELLNRHEQKHPAPSATAGHVLNPLDDLQRILNSYSKIDGTVIPKDLVVAFRDLSINLGIEQATRIARVVGMTPSNNRILVSALMAFLNSELQQVKQGRKRRPTRAHGQPSPSSVDVDSTLRTSIDDSRFSAEPTPKVHHPTRPSSAQVRSSTEDIGGKSRPGHGNRQTFSATAGAPVAPPERPRQGGGRATLASTGPASTSAAGTGAPKVVVPTASTGRPAAAAGAPAVAAAEHSAVAPESPQRGGEVDWSQVPLPAHWERKLLKDTNRYVYINHETKQTQWQHPLEPAKARKQRRRAEEDSSGAHPTAATGPQAEPAQPQPPLSGRSRVATESPPTASSAESKNDRGERMEG